MTPKSKLNLGELYRESFKDYDVAPSPRVWEKLDQHPSVPTAGSKSWWQSGKAIWGAIGTTVVTVAVFLAVVPVKDKPDRLSSGPETELSSSSREIALPEQNKPATVDHNYNGDSTLMVNDLNGPAWEKNGSSAASQPIQQLLPSEKIVADQALNVSGEKLTKTVDFPTIAEKKPESVVAEVFTTMSGDLAKDNTPPAHSDVTQINENADQPLDIVVSKDQTICNGESITIGVGGGNTYYWSTGEFSDSIVVRPATSSVYRVTAYDNRGNSKTGEVIVNVEECAKIFVPNTFTPNYDGINDEFKAIGSGFLEFRMVITDKAGIILFDSDDINTGWDGTYRGSPVDIGNYFYVVNYTDTDGLSKVLRGRLMLLR